MLPLIWSKTLPCYWLYLRNILILDTCMAEVSYLGDRLRREYCFLFLTFKTCLQRQSQQPAKKEKNKTRQPDTVVVTTSFFGFNFTLPLYCFFQCLEIITLCRWYLQEKLFIVLLGHLQLTTFVDFFLRELHRGWLRQWFILGSICQEIRCFVSSYLHLLLHWGRGMSGRGKLL